MKNRRPTDNGCCSVNFLRYLLFIYNFIFYVSLHTYTIKNFAYNLQTDFCVQFAGLAILFLGLWTIFVKSHYVVLLASKTYAVTSYIFVGIGGVCIIIGALGCWSISRKSRPLVFGVKIFNYLCEYLGNYFLVSILPVGLVFVRSRRWHNLLCLHWKDWFATEAKFQECPLQSIRNR